MKKSNASIKLYANIQRIVVVLETYVDDLPLGIVMALDEPLNNLIELIDEVHDGPATKK